MSKWEPGPNIQIKVIRGPDDKPVFNVFVNDPLKRVSIKSVDIDTTFEMSIPDWIAVSDLLIQRMQAHK